MIIQDIYPAGELSSGGVILLGGGGGGGRGDVLRGSRPPGETSAGGVVLRGRHPPGESSSGRVVLRGSCQVGVVPGGVVLGPVTCHSTTSNVICNVFHPQWACCKKATKFCLITLHNNTIQRNLKFIHLIMLCCWQSKYDTFWKNLASKHPFLCEIWINLKNYAYHLHKLQYQT